MRLRSQRRGTTRAGLALVLALTPVGSAAAEPGASAATASDAGVGAAGGSGAGAGAAGVAAAGTAALTLSGPASSKADRRLVLVARWLRADESAVVGTLQLERRDASGWTLVNTADTNEAGRARFGILARETGHFRVVGEAPETAREVSGRYALEVTPAYPLVADLPGAPAAKPLPAQPRAARLGADVRVSRIPGAVWKEMVGRTWHRGCPVGRSGLRLLQANYVGFDGFRHRGEVVVAARVADEVADVLEKAHDAGYPIRAMYRQDRFGWSPKLRGANDYRSMAADNTSGLNCRQVVGRPGSRSPHAYGTAIDINPLENPYVARDGVWPSAYYVDRAARHPAVLTSRSPVVRTFLKHGWKWGANFRDWQHFDKSRGYD